MPLSMGVARLGAIRAAVDLRDEVLEPFVMAFADRIAVHVSVEIPMTLDALTVYIPLLDGADLHRVGPLLDDSGLEWEHFDKLVELADRAITTEKRPVELAVRASRDRGLAAASLRLGGGWFLVDVYDALLAAGLPERAVGRWDLLSAALLSNEAVLLDIGFDAQGLFASIHVEHRIAHTAAARWTSQLDHVLGRLEIPEPQRAWMRAIHPRLCERETSPFLWTLHVRPEGVPPIFDLTVPRVPVTMVLRHALDHHPDTPDLGTRLGGLMGALERDADEVERWRIRLSPQGPQTWIRP
ncbi:MAG: hypothetical protein EA397_05570 [Deltaproteobacteria bacterium]|nr:MAG: hypothetical protein EA397_05570 [Deltaproteobacteria bacterium]